VLDCNFTYLRDPIQDKRDGTPESEGCKVVSPVHRQPLVRKIYLPGTNFLERLSLSRGYSALGRIS